MRRDPAHHLKLSLIVAASALLLAASAANGASAALSLRATQNTQSRSKQAAALVEEGAAALEKNELAAAKALFQRALEADPNSATAHTFLGVIADRAGDLAEAERHFAAAAIADPLSPSARNNHGAVLLKLGRVKQATAQFETSLRLDKNQPSALVNLAQIRFASGTPEGFRAALELFERAQAIAPDAEVARALVVTALNLGQRERTATYYRDYVARLSNAGGEANSSSSRAELGEALLQAKLIDEAVTELTAAVAADQTNVKAIVNLARAYRAQNDIKSAGRLLETAVARGLDAAPVYAELADIYESIGRVENAIPAMRLAVERDPQSEAYRFRYALMLIDTKAPKAAVIRLQEALSQFPRSAQLWFALGIAYFSDYQTDEAARAFTRTIELDPKAAPAIAYMGFISTELGQYAEAIAYYERALAANEQFAAAHFMLADVLMKQSTVDTTRAETHLTRALALDPTLTLARFALAKLYVSSGRLADAAAQFEVVIKEEPNFADAYYQLSRAYMRLKRKAEADSALASFKRLKETQKEQAEVERKDLVRRLANVRF